MAEKKSKSEFWTTLPGVLTGAGALITAVAGLILGLYQYGVLGSKQGSAPKAETAAVSDSGARPHSANESAGAAAGSPATAAASTAPHPEMTTLTATDGTVTTVFADSLHEIAQYDKSLHLASGQTIAFDKIRRIDFIATYEDSAKVRLTLANNQTLDGSLPSGGSIQGFHGENELGPFEIRMDRLRQVAFAR